MYVKVRTMDGSQTAVVTISKLTSVDDFRLLIQDKLKVAAERQRLFYRGKQMEDGYKMFDYSINVNDVIQLLIKPVLQDVSINVTDVAKSFAGSQKMFSADDDKVSDFNFHGFSKSDQENVKASSTAIVTETCRSDYYRVGDLVDAKSEENGSWWESKVVNITTPLSSLPDCDDSGENDGLLYHILYEKYDEDPPTKLPLKSIRPRARRLLKLDALKPGDVIMANYNLENDSERGFWFDCKVIKITNTRTQKSITAAVNVAREGPPMENCQIKLVDEIFAVEPNVKIADRNADDEMCIAQGSPVKRTNAPYCNTCKDNPRRKCNECGCNECGLKDQPEKQIMCDECDSPFHIYCLKPPLTAIPEEDEWFCPLCKNDSSEIVGVGEGLKASKKKAKMASTINASTRDWGKGFACAGRQRICTLVPTNHFGPIPGVEVGTLWKFRLQASEAGVHRPHVAGIHGTEKDGSYSIVLSGGYEDDEDCGDDFTYTGSGGRDLSGNKRTAQQSCDQLLARFNKALAINCNAPLNKNGAEAKDWKGGKPVRVIRNCKGRKHSKFAPEEGNRYDGIYKVVKYWPEKGKSGFVVWRYMLRRDDPIPPPWTKEGSKRIESLGLVMQYPDGYLDAQKAKEEAKEVVSEEEENKKKGKKRGRKSTQDEEDDSGDDVVSPPSKMKKMTGFELGSDWKANITKDTANIKLWGECKQTLSEGRAKFLNAVEERFSCICCQELVYKPVTTVCGHNICHMCLSRSFKAEVYTCPACRHDLGKEYDMKVNTALTSALVVMFPGYDSGR